ncbi:sperm-associated acrosin inhibitor-like [Meles meles]|uniref:sperm-associated acrosin inhibitor-like n=1 Tax=Meles meles TaxID=9662 RepID=UPI001E698E76|nr:sperm-associated acrosin inhibitor-like [Meles meles]
MSLFSSWIKAIFIIALVFPLYSETSFAPPVPNESAMVDCTQFPPENKYCTREWDPLCASNGRTYGNPCIFCRGRGTDIYFLHFGSC